LLTLEQQEAKDQARAYFAGVAAAAAAALGDTPSPVVDPACANIIGIGVGTKVIAGTTETGQEALRVYVRVKIPPGQLSPQEIVPPRFGNLPTDVMEIGDVLALQSLQTWQRFSRHRPASCGVSLGHPDITVGTLGCLVERESRIYILSNNHILAGCNTAAVGDPILQPGPSDGGSLPGDAIATLSQFAPIVFSGPANSMDAAIAEVNTPADVEPEIIAIGCPRTATKQATRFQSVRKHGRTTGHTLGIVDDVSADLWVKYRVNNQMRMAWFVDQIAVRGTGTNAFSSSGDSGSLIVDAQTLEPVGLLFAESRSLTIANPIDLVLPHFGVTIVGQ
jgi:hypothetical protein